MAGHTRRSGLQAPTSAQSRRADVGVLVVACIVHEPPAAIADLAVLPGVLGSRPLRRTKQVRLRSAPLRLLGGTAISAISLRRLVHNAG